MISNCCIRCDNTKECALVLQLLDLIGVHWRSGYKPSDLVHQYDDATTYYNIEYGILSYSRMADGHRHVITMSELFKLANFDAKIIIMLKKIMSKPLRMLYNKT